ncbi:MAG: DUF2188 domain-containing protein [Acholeplasmatales bacterium]|nr:DUF2188 domain-containing protein [Acholeplasmatales bacterium]
MATATKKTTATKATTAKTTTAKAAPAKASKPKATVEKAKAKETKSTGKTIYHVSKRTDDKNNREWKVFIQGSDKVIKIFKTQQEALDYATNLRKDKDTTVMLHGLDGKIRKY